MFEGIHCPDFGAAGVVFTGDNLPANPVVFRWENCAVSDRELRSNYAALLATLTADLSQIWWSGRQFLEFAEEHRSSLVQYTNNPLFLLTAGDSPINQDGSNVLIARLPCFPYGRLELKLLMDKPSFYLWSEATPSENDYGQTVVVPQPIVPEGDVWVVSQEKQGRLLLAPRRDRRPFPASGSTAWSGYSSPACSDISGGQGGGTIRRSFPSPRPQGWGSNNGSWG